MKVENNMKVCIKFKIILVSLLAITLIAPSILCMPKKAYAYQIIKTLSWKTNINASILTNGAINVNEEKIIDITKFIEKAKKYNPNKVDETSIEKNLQPLVWSFVNFPEKKSSVDISNARIAILSNEDSIIGNWKNVEPTQFLSKWRSDNGPSESLITYDQEKKQMFFYSELTNPDQVSEKEAFEIMTQMTGVSDPNQWQCTKAVIFLNYTIQRAAVIYKDVADFQWIYLTDTWQMDSYDVNLSVSVPIGKESIANPLGKVTDIEPSAEATTERNIYAFGHGSSTGIVDLNANGIITVDNKIVPGNSDAEIRIVFPAAWLSNLDKGSDISQSNQTKLTSILKEESVWRDFRTNNVNKMLYPLTFIGICLVFLIIVLIINIRYRRKFSSGELSNTNLTDLHPCLLVRLKNWNHRYTHDIVVNLLHLNEIKAISIKRLASGDFEIKLTNKDIVKDPYKATSLNITDIRTINFLFGKIACNNPILKLSDIYNYAKARPMQFLSQYKTWESLLTDEVNRLANFKSSYDKIRHFLIGISFVILGFSLILGILLLDAIIPIAGLITAFTSAFVGNTLRNKVYFIDAEGKKVKVNEINIGLAKYNDTIDLFKNKAIVTIKNSVLESQDIISRWGLENTRVH